MRIEAVRGDITAQEADAVVNAANSGLLGGGGVDGAIHRAAGPRLLQACRELRATSLPDGLPVGQAVATPGFDLPARWVIHTVGPNRHAGQTDPALLRAAFRSSLELAQELGCRSVAVPAISAGVYGWDADAVARAAVAEARALAARADTASGVEVCGTDVVDAAAEQAGGLQVVRFVLFSDRLLRAFQAALGA
ncbi:MULTISPECIES: O-acetyl-ADP-ribose deacetylase [unclassified Actinomyces]|uniref:O-acetyl-ADP-ribose deacetylase n=1 Tax=unclassified Actinomyces TaxID=2609248 RepID=UPI0013A6ED45|nr:MULTISPECIES: O-acetyl-ADP-ribose deacetylase [unclassified Actinomyces]MBW3068036.1 O-acetyl-ADP-ribose deacetylase [Actinomyces sp. 594]NDR53259.1 O-acetyl-ADP-ribose deacetylase [Actinomyces sp. 565]